MFLWVYTRGIHFMIVMLTVRSRGLKVIQTETVLPTCISNDFLYVSNLVWCCWNKLQSISTTCRSSGLF